MKNRFAFVVGHPLGGGGYLTKELLRTIGLDHTRIPEALAYDGFPNQREICYEPAGDGCRSLIPEQMDAALLAQDRNHLVQSRPVSGFKRPRQRESSRGGAELTHGCAGLSSNLSYNYRLRALPAKATTTYHGEVWFSLKMAF